MFEPGRIGRAQHAVFGEGVVQRQVGDLVFPAFVVDGDEPARGIVAQPLQGGGRPVGGGVAGAVGAGDGEVGGDDPHGQLTGARQVRAVVEPGQYGQLAVVAQPGQELGAGAGQVGEKRLGVEPAVNQHQHVGAQQRQQPSRVIDFAGGRCPEHRAQQRSGAGLDHRHQPDHRIPGGAQRGAELAQPGPVAVGVGHLERHAPVERDGAVAAEPHAGGVRRGDRAGQHLEQRAHRRRAQAAPQVSKGFGRRRLPAARRGGEFGPHLAVAQPGNRHNANTKYTPTRDGSARNRRSAVLVSASTASTNSTGICQVSSPR